MADKPNQSKRFPAQAGVRTSALPLERLADWFSPSLILLSLLAGYAKYHRYPLLTIETMLCAVALLAFGIGLCLVSYLRRETLYPLVLGLLILKACDVQFGLFGWLIGGAAGLPAGAVKPLLLVAFFGFMFLLFALRREIGRIVFASWGVILLTTFLLPSGRIPAGQILDRPIPPRPDLPPVLHLILDEQIGVAGIPRDLPGGLELQEHLASWLLDRGFTVYGSAFSQYSETQFALASLLNGETFSIPPDYIIPTSTGYRITRNDWLRSLSEAGYSIRIYQSGWLDFCHGEGFPEYCYVYPTNSISALRAFTLDAWTRARLILPRVFEGTLNFIPWQQPQLSTLTSPSTLDKLAEDIRAHPRGTVFFAHLLWPHYAYVFNPDCELRPDIRTWANVGDTGARGREEFNSESEREYKYPLYFQQVRCVVKRVDALLEQMQRDGTLADAVVIIHGDHGSRLATRAFRMVDPGQLSERDLIDEFSTLMAIRVPNRDADYVRQQASIQQVFARRVLNRPLRGAGAEVFMRPAHNPRGEGSLLSRSMVEMPTVDLPPWQQ